MSIRAITNYLVDIVLGKKIYTCNYCGSKWKSLPSSMDNPELNNRTCSMSCFIEHNPDVFK